MNDQTATASVIFAGLILGFLFFNFYPAKIWSGSTGKSTYGFILAVLSVLSGAKLATAILILLLPITDFVLVVIGRIRNHNVKNPLDILGISDRTHLHHKLLDLGYSERRIAFFEYLITGLLGAIALATTGAYRAFVLLSSIVVIAAFIMLLTRYIRTRQRESRAVEESPEKRYSY